MHEVLQPPAWVKPIGYSNGVAATGRMVFIAGQIGWNAQGAFETDDFVAQTRQALANVVTVLRQAGGEPDHVTSMTWYMTDKQDYLSNLKPIGTVWREIMGRSFPAIAAVEVAGLIESRAKIEIQATAVIPEAQARPGG
jgi:enamine deaminase RidA (YjgF/YER057c/UK114 family)